MLWLAALLISVPTALANAPAQSAFDRQLERAQVDVPRIREIFGITADPTQPLTKSLHSEFWGLLLTRIQGDPQEMSEGMRRGVVEGFEYQCELWKSIELSAKAGRVIRTPGLSQFERPHSSITSSYAAQESSMLNAAATGRPYVSEDGHKSVIDAPTAERIQTRFSEVLRRFDRLLDPKWRD